MTFREYENVLDFFYKVRILKRLTDFYFMVKIWKK